MKITKGHSPIAYDGPILSRNQMQKELARQAAREKGLAKYICISCGHYTDLETQQVYGFARPKRGLVWCETCNDWLRVMPKRKPKALPETPLF